mgnify:CR=1 FL=1
MTGYDRLYVEYLYHFNVTRDYFECHELLEELWMEEGRDPFWQGLLQVAVGLYHFRNGNRSGSLKLFIAATDKLAAYPADARGINLRRLLDDVGMYKEKLLRYDGQPFEFYDLDIEISDPALAAEVETLKRNPPHREEYEGR